ncbi:MAG: archaellin/type IV pilin N-terminal domain-containing protein [Sulfolobaceae archaeon]
MRRGNIKRAVSSILGTIIIVAITIAMGGLLYAYSQGLFGSMTQTTNVQTTVKLLVNPSTNTAFLYYQIANQGTIAVNITSISIAEVQQNSNLLTKTIVLQPGQTTQGYIMLNMQLVAGKQYTVVVQGQFQNGQPYSQIINVLASTT